MFQVNCSALKYEAKNQKNKGRGRQTEFQNKTTVHDYLAFIQNTEID